MKKNTEKTNAVGSAMKKSARKKFAALITSGTALALSLVLTMSVGLTGCSGESDYFSVPESKLPIKDSYALNRYSYDDVSSVQATLRADILNVTERGLARQTPEILTDEFSLVYDVSKKELKTAYERVVPTSNLKVSSIEFTEYPSPSHGIAAKNFTDQAAAAKVSENDYFAYYKYMLMTQGQHLAHEAMRRSAASYRAEGDTTPRTADESLTGWLKKHPSADAQYGEVKGENNAVKKVIKLDPLYRGQHTTGLYLPAGEVATVKIEGLKPGERITLNLGEQNTLAWRGSVPADGEKEIQSITGNFGEVNFPDATSDAFFKKADILTAAGSFYKYNGGDSTPFLQSQWKRQNARAPWLSATFTFDKNGEYEIGFAFGGLINLNPYNCYSDISITVTGAVETPHYVLGVTSPEYFDTYLRNAPGVIAVLDTENGQLMGPTGEMDTDRYMRRAGKDEIDKLAMLWHSFLSVNESFTGGVYNRYNKVMFDWHVPAGAAVALGGHTYACPTGWFDGAMNYRGLLAGGTWGILHEIGHNHGSAYGSVWGFGAGREGEVRNNALTLLAYIISCDVGTTIRNGGGAEHGAYANPYNVLSETLTFKGKTGDYDDGSYGYFQCLGMYANLMHSFGADKFYELLYTYGEQSAYVTAREGDTSGIWKRADFAYRCSLVYGMNFLKYFNTYYCANIPDDYFSEEQLSYIKGLPVYEPISNFYAGEIDEVKTAGDFKVNFGSDVEFDLLGKTICTLDDGDKKGFEIISVGNPEHGSLKDIGEGKYSYSFNGEYTGATDKFSFKVKLTDGIIHEFTVHLRINYNGARLSTYPQITVTANDAEGKLEEAMTQTSSATPVISSIASPILAYTTTSGECEVKVVEFFYQATETGTFELALRGDDYAYAYFGKDFNSLEKIMTLKGYSGAYSDNLTYKVSLVKDEFYAVRLYNLNTGGKGGVALGIRKEGESKFAELNATAVYHPDVTDVNNIETYVFEPHFLISKKDNVKLSNSGTDKSQWTVVTAPDGDHIHEGRYLKETMTDETTGETTEFITDKWTWLIDGQTGTMLHTAYTGAGVRPPTPEAPDVFIIDTTREQTFNYFSIATRNTANALIRKYRLSVSSDNVTYKEVSSTDLSDDEDVLAYKNAVATIEFPQLVGRYWKLEVMETTGKNFTIISELDAGIASSTQRILPSTSDLLYKTDGWKNSNSIAEEPNGYIISESIDEKAVIKFNGESIGVYAATGDGYGTADIYLDGKKYSSIDLNSNIHEARKLAIFIDNLDNKEHTLEIITTSANKVMLNVIGIPYMASLVNAPNIYAERALAISLTVFAVLFAALAALVCALVFSVKFRNLVFGNKFMKKLDNRTKKADKTTAKAKPETDGKSDVVADETKAKEAKTKTDVKANKKPADKAESTKSEEAISEEKPKRKPKAKKD